MAFAYDDLSDDDRERFGRMRDESLKGAKEYSQSWPDPVALPEGEIRSGSPLDRRAVHQVPE